MFVSIITPTYNRAHFFPRLLEGYLHQTYPHEMEWIILDDSEDPNPFLSKLQDLTIRYITLNEKKPMGEKLNLLTKEARGDLIVVMDDDDYYPPERIEITVRAFAENPHLDIAGCSKVYMYSTATDEIYVAGPYHERHALNCTMAFRRRYLDTHAYDDAEPCAVERAITNNFTEPMIQLASKETILHIIHSSNTFKAKMSIGKLVKTSHVLEDFIEPNLICYYKI
jgi:glycosyltransferase involved in cell wall biosynthesis